MHNIGWFSRINQKLVLHTPSKSCRSILTGISPHRRKFLSTDLFASREVPVDDILALDGLAAPVLVRLVLHPSAAVMTPGLEDRTDPISGSPGRYIGRQSSSSLRVVTASVARTQDSDRSGDHTLVGR